MLGNGFCARERAVLRRLNTPEKIQRFLDGEIGYNKEPEGPTCRSPRRVLRDRVAHCMEGALFAAAALARARAFRRCCWIWRRCATTTTCWRSSSSAGCWGAIAKSNYAGLRFREPVYRTLRELAMSYFEHYYNLAGEKTLRTYSRPVNLRRFDGLEWMTAERDVWEIPEYLCTVAHTALLPGAVERRLGRMDARLMAAGKVGMVE